VEARGGGYVWLSIMHDCECDSQPATAAVDTSALLLLLLCVSVGKRRYDRKQSGYGGQTKPVFHKKVRGGLELGGAGVCVWGGGGRAAGGRGVGCVWGGGCRAAGGG
jgi:hypothetical protein